MKAAAVLDALRTANLNSLHLAIKDCDVARSYLASSVRQYDELAGRGLQPADPVEFLYSSGWVGRGALRRVSLPALLSTAGGTRLDELYVLGVVTAVLQPKRIFEIGTFMGRTTSVFILNAPAEAQVFSLDLPAAPDSLGEGHLDTDITLMRERRVGAVLSQLGLTDRYRQLLGDSISFDPGPYRDSIELGFIDGAHARRYVANDTEKMAAMAADRGLVFWHDYGGKGHFRELTAYLELLSSKIAMHRVPFTTLAWTSTSELKRYFTT